MGGLERVRPRAGTYGRYEFSQLPPLPFALRGDFHWLEHAPSFRDEHIGRERAKENARALEMLRATAERMGLPLPAAFVAFMQTPTLNERIRSNTDAFLNLCSAPIPSPRGTGYLVRFLADSQGCLFWYLYLTSDGSDHAVVASPGFYGTDEEQWDDEEPDAADIVCCAESFEAFLGRFWLENEIWFAAYRNTPMPDAGRAYIAHYRQLQEQLASS